MSGLAVTIPIAIIVGLVALAAFMWTLKSGQYEDMEGASQRILDSDDTPRPSPDAAASETTK